jgi:hypothetical protein
MRTRLLVGQVSAERMPPSNLQDCIHGALSGKQPRPRMLFSWAGAKAVLGYSKPIG